MKYLILQNPGHNRVYYNYSDKLALAELTIASKSFESACDKIEITEIAGIRYLSFYTETPLIEKDIAIISGLSFVFAIYRLDQINGQDYLLPIRILSNEFIDGKISSILKYQGKTNELFTRMMINVALMSSGFDYKNKIRLLDPVAGKGTTMFESLKYGFNSYGVEISQKQVHEAIVFFKKFIEQERFKHTFAKRKVAGNGNSDGVHIQEFEFARTKEDFKNGQNILKFGMINADTQFSSSFFPSGSFHLIVGDLPYGIFHGSSSGRKKKSPSRNPLELLESCLSEWKKLLKKSGSIVLAWNSFLISRTDLSNLFRKEGLEILDTHPYDMFEHKVDRSIKRDIIVAIKN